MLVWRYNQNKQVDKLIFLNKIFVRWSFSPKNDRINKLVNSVPPLWHSDENESWQPRRAFDCLIILWVMAGYQPRVSEKVWRPLSTKIRHAAKANWQVVIACPATAARRWRIFEGNIFLENGSVKKNKCFANMTQILSDFFYCRDPDINVSWFIKTV